jgi:hypothetical protein
MYPMKFDRPVIPRLPLVRNKLRFSFPSSSLFSTLRDAARGGLRGDHLGGVRLPRWRH